MRIPGHDGNPLSLENRRRQHGKNGDHVGETDIDAVMAQHLEQMPIELYRSAGLAIASLLTHRIDPYVRRNFYPTGPHRDDVDALHPLHQRGDPEGGKAQDGIVRVRGQVKEKESHVPITFFGRRLRP